METCAYVCLYKSYLEALKPYTDAELGRIMRAMLLYGCYGENPSVSGNERFIWPTIRQQIDRDQQSYAAKCQQNRINGRKGGRPRKQAQAPSPAEGFLEEPKKAREKETEKEKETEMEKDTFSQGAAHKGPALQEVKDFCKAQKLHMDPERFFNYYAASGWLMGRKPIVNWQAAARLWEEKEYGKSAENLQCPGVCEKSIQLGQQI